ncbi:MAG TPA: hypothetical protein VFB58_09520 [Chloroflexota bacterium]|nr:hypothetical protein [Chloroflexota bacterium]
MISNVIMSYRRMAEVTDEIDGVRTTVALQLRHDPGRDPWYPISFRAQYPGAHFSRRFYWSAYGPWTLPPDRALALLNEAERGGMLSEDYSIRFDDHRPEAERFVVSSALDRAERLRHLEEITCAQGEPNWGADPFFVVSMEDGRPWRAVMLVSEDRTLMTFRVTTDDAPRPAVKDMGRGGRRRLYNIMPDISPETVRRFRTDLETVLAAPEGTERLRD